MRAAASAGSSATTRRLTADFAAAAGGEPVMPGYGTLLAQLTSADELPVAAPGDRVGLARR